MPLCTKKQVRASKYINPLMPASRYIVAFVITGCEKFLQFAPCMDNIVCRVLYYPCSMVLELFFCQFTRSAAQTHCARRARRPQLISKKFLEEEIFTGTSFRELAFDRKNRKKFLPHENFPLYRPYLLCRRGFVAISKSFLHENWGRGILWWHQ